MKKSEAEQKLINLLHLSARNQGYVAAGIGEAGYRRIHRMTKQQIEDEIDRLTGVKTIDQLPKDHEAVIVG